MNKFKYLKNALDYHKKCFICHNTLSISDTYLVHIEDNEKLFFPIQHNSNDIISIDPQNNKIEYFNKSNDDFIQNYVNANTIYLSNLYNKFDHVISIDCNHCYQFGYSIRIMADLKKKKVEKITLNSEFISLDENCVVNEVVNLYSLNKTKYVSYDRLGNESKLEFPLMKLDLNNPKELLTRINNIKLFI